MEKKYVDALRYDDNAEIKNIYDMHRPAFFGFAKKYGLGSEDLSDLYQEAFLAMRRLAISGKLNEVKSSFRTYLFGVGKYMIFNLLKQRKQKLFFDPKEYTEIVENTLEIDPPLTYERKLLEYFFKMLGKSCKELLTLSFYRGLTNDEIAEMGNYENESVVRSQKSRCLKNLKQMIAERNR